ncbi:MAG: hypothetical protein U1D55_12620 [Phycisphaerae bacterium]
MNRKLIACACWLVCAIDAARADVTIFDYILDEPANTNQLEWDWSFKGVGGTYYVCGMEISSPTPISLKRLTVIAGGAGPGQVGPADFSHYPYFAVNVRRGLAEWAAQPLSGTDASFSFNQPSSAVAWGIDYLGQPTWKFTFEFPYLVDLRPNQTYLLSWHTALDIPTQGAFGNVRTNVPGPLGYQARSDAGTLGYLIAADTWAWKLEAQTPCPGDLDRDRDVDEGDLGILLSAWLRLDDGDLNGDNVTDEADLGILLANWQATCP